MASPSAANPLGVLAACAGKWRGTNTLQDPHTNAPEDSAATLTAAPILGGRFVRLDYTWGYQGAPQEGSLLLGFDAQAETVTAHFIDTWHMSDKVLSCVGPKPAAATLNVRGSYAAPPGPDWGWRIEIAPDPAGTFSITMFNIFPGDEREELAVRAVFQRA